MVMDVRWGSASHQGRVREHNEDTVLAGPFVFAVADGMGGYAGGEVASGIAAAGLASVCDLHECDDPVARLRGALAEVNDEIRRRASLDGAVREMGTTVAGVALVSGLRLLVFNVGDSRVYRLRAGQLSRLTEDHSVVAEMVRAGELTEDEARQHPHRNVVTRALGAEPTVEPAISLLEARVGDCFLVASDGLFNEVPDSQIGDVLATPGTVERRARALIDAALFRGARDNVSAVVLAVAGASAGDGLDADTAPSAHHGARAADHSSRSTLAAAPAPPAPGANALP